MPFRIVCFVLAALLSFDAGAGIYTWKDAQGHTHFGDRPPSGSDPKALDPKINTISRPDIQAPDAAAASGTRKVVIYTAEWCGVCRRAKGYFKDKGIAYREYDVEKSQKGRRDYAQLKGTGVPIILVGEQRLNGFSPARFEAVYYRSQ